MFLDIFQYFGSVCCFLQIEIHCCQSNLSSWCLFCTVEQNNWSGMVINRYLRVRHSTTPWLSCRRVIQADLLPSRSYVASCLIALSNRAIHRVSLNVLNRPRVLKPFCKFKASDFLPWRSSCKRQHITLENFWFASWFACLLTMSQYPIDYRRQVFNNFNLHSRVFWLPHVLFL